MTENEIWSKIQQQREIKEEALVILNPLSRFKYYFDLISSLFLFFNGIIIPLYISFALGESLYDCIFWINRFIDLTFLGN